MTEKRADPRLPPFDENASCLKCGGDEVSTRFERTAHCSGVSYSNRWCPLYAMLDHHTRGAACCNNGEHLHRMCQRCRYQWSEACWDDLGATSGVSVEGKDQ